MLVSGPILSRRGPRPKRRWLLQNRGRSEAGWFPEREGRMCLLLRVHRRLHMWEVATVTRKRILENVEVVYGAG